MKEQDAVKWATELVAAPPEIDVFSFLAKKLTALTSSIFAIVAEYHDADSSMTCVGFAAKENALQPTMGDFGKGLIGATLPFSSGWLDTWRTGRVHLLTQGSRDALIEMLLQASDLPKQTIISIGDIYSVGLNQRGRVIGAAVFGLRKKAALDAEAVALCTPLAAIAMQHEIDQRMLLRFEERFQFAMQNSLDVFSLLDNDFRILKVSPSVEQLLGLKPEEIVGKRISELGVIDQSDVSQAAADETRFLAEGQPDRKMYKLKSSDGSERFAEISVTRHLGNGHPGGLIAMLRDVTQNVRAVEARQQSEAFYRGLIEASPDPILVHDLQGNILAAGAKVAQIMGYQSIEEFLRETPNVSAVLNEQGRQRYAEIVKEVLRNNIPRNVEYQIFRKDGSFFLGEANSATVHRPDGSLIGLITVVRDITARRRMEAALREKEARLASIFRAAPIGIGMVVNRVIQEVNEALCRITGYSAAELIGQSARLLYDTDEDYEYVGRVKYAEVAKYGTGTVDTHWRRKDGRRIDVLLSSTPLDEADLLKGVTFTALDITDRLQALAALRQKTEELDLFFNSTLDLLSIADTDGHFRRLNPQWERTLGYSLDELLSKRFIEFVHPEDVPATVEAVLDLGTQKEVLNFVNRFRCKDGSYRWIEWRSTPHGETIYAAARDITDRRRNEILLTAQKNLAEKLATVEDLRQALSICLEYAIDYSELDSGAVYLLDDREGMRQAVHAGRWTETDEAVLASETGSGNGAGEPAEAERVRALKLIPVTIEGKAAAFLCLTSHTRDKVDDLSKHWLESIAAQIGSVMGRLRAVERKKQMEEQLHQAMKMEAIGRLTGGVAHHFNNLLTVIQGQAEMVMRAYPLGDAVRVDLQQILEASHRAADLTAGLLAFSRKQMISPRIVNLRESLAGSIKVLKNLIGDNIELQYLPHPSVGRVKVDPVQIDLALMNLVLNAIDAMPDGGRLTLELTERFISEKEACAHVDVAAGRYAVLTVTDTGRGMSPEVLDHIFEPFFTTKEIGRGTGLGLPMIYGSIRQNGGFLEVESQVDVGTTIRIFLPLAEELPAADGPVPLPESPRGRETVLLVEDEEMVRQLARKILERQGYRVLAAAQAEDVAALIRENGGAVDLLLTDMMLPGMNGRQLFESLRGQIPGLPVVYMSGYLDDVLDREATAPAQFHFIQKPFSIHALTATIREALDLKRA